jgi:hypothetical protein
MRSWQGFILVWTVFSLLLLPALAVTSASAAPINDDFADRLAIQLGIADTRSNAGASIEAGERLTANDPNGFGCDLQGAESSGGIQMDSTMWWKFSGNGGPITVSTLSSTFDTVLAVYDEQEDKLIGCNDDLQPADSTRPTLQYRVASELLFDSVAGRQYAVQVGACMPPEACGTASGNVTLRVSGTPANDNRATATPIGAGNPVLATNTGGTTENGEVVECDGHLYGKTVWFRYTAPAAGTAVFSASGFDSVLAVYQGTSTAPLGCNDDAVSGQPGASRLPASQPLGPPVEVTPGDYLIQVGGYYDPGFTPVAARNGPLEAQVEFTADTDIDNDGVDASHDCDDSNPAIRPGLPELPNNDVDENCDGLKAFDRDNDGYLAEPAGDDCHDQNRHIHPHAREIPGNGVDENCDGKKAPLQTLRTTILMIYAIGDSDDPRTRVFGFLLNDVAKGSRVSIHCKGRGCRYPSRRYRVRQTRSELRLPGGFRLAPGAEVIVEVTKHRAIGRARSFVIREGKEPIDRKYCVGEHGNKKPC